MRLEVSPIQASFDPLGYRSLAQYAARIAGSGHKAVELYAGNGVLSLYFVSFFSEIEAVETNRNAVKRVRLTVVGWGRKTWFSNKCMPGC